MAKDDWSYEDKEKLIEAVGTKDVDEVVRCLQSMGKTFPRLGKESLRSLYNSHDGIFRKVVELCDSSFYLALRRAGMPPLDGSEERLFGCFDSRYFRSSNKDPREPTPEQIEAMAQFIRTVLDDGYSLADKLWRDNSEEMRNLFTRHMHQHIDLLSSLEKAGYTTLPQSTIEWCEIIEYNNVTYAEYCLDSGLSLPTEASLVIGGGVNLEMLEWLVSHGAQFNSVFSSASREVLERCYELGIPLAKHVSPAPNTVLAVLRGTYPDVTVVASSVGVTHGTPDEFKALLDDGGSDLLFRVYDGVLKQYRGSDEVIILPSGVTSIASLAFFRNEHVKQVIVSEGVEEIGQWAFASCPSLELVHIPCSMTKIDYHGAFKDCPRLACIEVDERSSNYRSYDGVLCDARGTVMEYPDALLQVEVLEIPEGVTQFYSSYFKSYVGLSGIRRVVLPSTMESMSFSGMDTLEQIDVAEGNTRFRVLNGALLWRNEREKAWGVDKYPPNRPMGVFVVPEDCSFIHGEAFANCSLLKVIVNPSVTDAYSQAFAGCGEVELTGDYLPFDEDDFAKELGTALMLPSIPIEAVPAKLKGFAATGYMHLVCDGRPISQQVNEGYTKYVRSQKKRLIPLMATDIKVAEYILNEGLIPKKEVPALEELAEESGNGELKDLVQRYASNPKPLAGWREEHLGSSGFEVQEEAPAPKVEPLVADLLARHEIPPKLKTQIRKGVLLADGSGISSPEAVQLLVLLSSTSRKNANTARYSSKDYRYGIGLNLKMVDKLVELFDKQALSDCLESLFYDHNVQEALVAVCAFGDDEVVRRLVESMKEWDDWYRGGANGRKDIAIARGALLHNESIEAMRHFESKKMLDDYARARDMSADELRDKTLSDFGFDRDGRKVFDLGTKIITATIGDDLKMVLFDDSEGKVVKSIPKRGTDPEKAEAAAAELAEMRKQIRTIVKQRKDLLFEDFLSGRERRIGAWKDAYLGNPVLRSVARLIVWQKGDVTFTVSDGRLVDATGASVKLPAGDVKVAHPIEMTKADVDAWREYFATRALKQPFAQVWEKVVPKASIQKDRYKGYPIPVYRFKGQEKHGIHLDLGEYNDTAVSISFDCASCKINQLEYVWHSLKNRVEIVSFVPVRGASPRKLNHLVAYLDRVCFYPRLASNDLTVMDDLKDPTLEQIIDYARIASESGATELAALLLEYREEHFPEYGSVESLLLD